MTRDDLILDRYEPLGTAGEGGFGTVEIAWDPRIQRKVAIKTIKLTALDAARAALPGAQAVPAPSTADRWHGAVPWDEYLADDLGKEPGAAAVDAAVADGLDPQEQREAARPLDQVTSLAHIPGLDEARTAAMLSDPGIVTVYDFEVRGRMAYLIMEYVEGITLTGLLADYPDFLTLDMVAAVFDAVAGALTTAHDAGVLHLDIKPDNILINSQGQVKVTDFGLATLADASGAGTTGGGTIGYMPLEQMRREHLDVRTDEWSLAVIAYEMLTGSNPFLARNLEEAEGAIENAELVLPSLCWENLDEQADDVVFYALDPDRGNRYESVPDFAEELDKFLGDPVQGTEQLALVVEDALGIYDEDDGEVSFEEPGGRRSDRRFPSGPGGAGGQGTPLLGGLMKARFPSARGEGRGQPGLLDRLLGILSPVALSDGGPPAERQDDPYPDAGCSDDDYAEEPTEPQGRRAGNRDSGGRGERRLRGPLGSRLSERTKVLAARVFAALASGWVAYTALANMQILSAGFGPGAPYVIAAGVLLVAGLGAVWAHIGALVAMCLMGITFILCGQPVTGAVLLIATVVWWYAVGHGDNKAATVALASPVLGAIGAGSAAPLLAGAVLDPVRAAATTAFAIVCAVAFGSLGTDSLLGWDAFAHWRFSQTGLEGGIVSMAANPTTWTTAFGWLAASAILSLLRKRGSRLLEVVGIALALVAVLVGSLAFAAPTPQLIAPTVIAAALLLASAATA